MSQEERNSKILVVDDDLGILETIKDVLETENYEVSLSSDGKEAIGKVKEQNFDLVITDIKMPGMNGIELLKAVKDIDSELQVIIITGFASIETAVEAIRKGAYDYIIKPFEMEKFLLVIKRAIQQRTLHLKNQELIENLGQAQRELEKRINQLFSLDEVSRRVSSVFELEEALESIINVLSELTKAKAVSLMLLEEGSKYLVLKVARGVREDLIERIKIKVGEGIIGSVAKMGLPISSWELKTKNINLGNYDKILFTDTNFISMPIVSKSQVIGVLNVSGLAGGDRLHEEDLRILSILTTQVSMAIENNRLYGKLQNSYLNTLNVLASAIEAKCRYTRGHSERVARYAGCLARYLGLSEKDIRKIVFACGVHDIGKINIPESILNKPAKLNEEEWRQMRAHPTKGADILVPLGILKEIVPLVKYHHEHFDGQGYPEGLTDTVIPYGARLIAIADAYDAMTSFRAYRSLMSQREALKEIEKNLGKQFDPELGEAFIKSAHLNNRANLRTQGN